MSNLNVLILPETVVHANGDSELVYTAVVLEHFMAAQGRDAQTAMNNLELVVRGTIAANTRKHQPIFAGLKPAPEHLLTAATRARTVVAMRQENAIAGVEFSLEPRLLPSAA